MRLAGFDGARGESDRVQAGAAQAVDGAAGDVHRQAGQQPGHVGDIAVVFTGLVGAAVIQVIDPAQSTRETIELCREAYAAGGDYALVLPPSYYSGLHAQSTVKDFFLEVADASPIPLLLYNFPPAAGGIDMSSDTIIDLAAHPRIAGCKLTCGNTGKLNRIAAGTRAATAAEPGAGFFCFGGSCDFTLQTAVGGGSGVIGGLANVAPKACVRLWQLLERDGFDMAEARRVQAVVARGDWAAIQGGVVATKSALESHFGYGGFARRPLPRPGKDETRRWREAFDELVALERSLEGRHDNAVVVPAAIKHQTTD